MPEPDLPPQKLRALEPDLPPQRVFLYAAAGGFIGALLAILIAKILAGPCCCPHYEREQRSPASVSSLSDFLYEGDRTLLA